MKTLSIINNIDYSIVNIQDITAIINEITAAFSNPEASKKEKNDSLDVLNSFNNKISYKGKDKEFYDKIIKVNKIIKYLL